MSLSASQPPMKIAFLASGAGTGMQAVIDACKNGLIHGEPVLLISNNSKSGAIESAGNWGIPTCHLSSVTHPDSNELDQAILAELRLRSPDIVLLAGYMKEVKSLVLKEYNNRIINIHPSLLPKHGGKGKYGQHVHDAVIKSGDNETGATIHLVGEVYDEGQILAQVGGAPVLSDDTPLTLSTRLGPYEHWLLVDTLAEISLGNLRLPGREGPFI